MSIKSKILLGFLAVSIVPIFIVVYLAFSNARSALMSARISQLNAVADLKVKNIEDFFGDLAADAEIAQDYYNVKANLPILTKLVKDRANPSYRKAKKMLDDQLRILQRVKGYEDVMLVNPEGVSVYASDAEHEGMDLFNPLPDPGNKAFENGKDGLYFSEIFINPVENNNFGMIVTAPVHDLDGDFAGVIAFEINMNPIYEFIQDTAGLGETGETLIGKRVGDRAIFLNPLRHDKDAALKRTTALGSRAAFPIHEAVQGRSGTGEHLDYRGEEVIAAWRHIPSLDWGLVAKIDVSEAFASVNTLKKFTFTIGVLAVVFAVATAYFIVKSIINPLLVLQRGIGIIGEGNLDYKVGSDSHDEIGYLSRAFDQMTQKLKTITASRDEMDVEIDRRRQIEEALRDSEARTRAVVDSAIDGIVTIDERGIVESVNPAASKLFGYAPDEVIGQNVKMLMPEPYRSEHDGYISNYKNTGKAKIIGSRREVTGLRKDGATFPMTLGVSEVQLDNTNIYTGLIRDITEMKEAEKQLKESHAQLVQSEKMSAVGNMVAGVAHELNNPMMGILNFIQYCRKKTSEDDRRYGVLEDAERETLRCQEIVQNLLTFSRMEKEGDEGRKKESLGTIFDRVFKLLAYRFGVSGISVNRHTTEGTPEVWMRVNSIQQVFFNLVGNALDALETSEKKEINIDIRPAGEFVQVTVADTGPGISRENLQKIFEPFYTTKQVGKGTGLGLSMCRSIVMAHGGDITCESKAGEGTWFNVLLPADIRKE